MRIVNSDTCRKVKFRDLLGGEVFRDHYGNVLIRSDASAGSDNAIDLSDGTFFNMDDDEEVERLDCELVLYN